MRSVFIGFKSRKSLLLLAVATLLSSCGGDATDSASLTSDNSPADPGILESALTEPDSVQILGTDRDETLIDLAQNEAGEFAVVGTTDGPIDGYPNRLSDAFVAKYDNTGMQMWVVRFGTPQDDLATAVAIDESGTVWVSGDTYGGMEGNENKGERDGFLAKFSSAGVQEWIVHISTDRVERARGLAVDSRGIATVVGTTYGEFPGFSHEGKLREAWITQIDPDGNRLWLDQFGSDREDTIVDVSVDADGNPTFCGYSDGLIGDKSSGMRDAFVGRYTNQGERKWIYQFGTSLTDVCYGQFVTESGEIFAVGVTEGSFSGAKNLGNQDAWAIKLSPEGVLQWVTQLGTNGEDGLSKVAVNSRGLIILGGVQKSEIEDGGLGGFDAILYVLDPNGKELIRSKFGTGLNDSVNGIAVTESQQLLIAGASGPGLFGTTGLGELDTFVARFNSIDRP